MTNFSNFWDVIDEEMHDLGFDRWMARAHTDESIIALTDEEYEALQVKAARSAYHGKDNGFTRAENYYFIAENIGADEANEYMKRGA